MERIFNHYTRWEWYLAWLYEDKTVDNIKVENARLLLSNSSDLHEAMYSVVNEWIEETAYMLSNSHNNRQSWLWRSCCMYKVQASIWETRIARFQLSDEEKILANKVADWIITYWENNLYDKHYTLCQKYIKN